MWGFGSQVVVAFVASAELYVQRVTGIFLIMPEEIRSLRIQYSFVMASRKAFR